VGDILAQLLGTALDDRLVATSEDDAIWGGMGGTDTAVFAGSASEYTLAASDNGAFYVTHIVDGETIGVDKVRDVEFFEFGDVTYSLTTMLSLITRMAPLRWSIRHSQAQKR